MAAKGYPSHVHVFFSQSVNLNLRADKLVHLVPIHVIDIIIH